MEIVLLVIGLVGLSVLLLGFNVFIRRKPFPDTHVGHNKEMKKRKIVCAKTMDKMEQAKVKKQMQFSNLHLSTEE